MGSSRRIVEGITIDSPGTMGRDDGFRIQRAENGWTVEVSIADMASVVAADPSLERRCSRIFEKVSDTNGRIIEQFLPHDVRDSVSLNQNETRPAITFTFDIDRSGKTELRDVERSYFLNRQAFESDKFTNHRTLAPEWRELSAALIKFDMRGSHRASSQPHEQTPSDFVARLMNMTNSHAGQKLKETGLSAQFCESAAGGYRASTEPVAMPNTNMPLARVTSAMWRYADIANQRQLMAAMGLMQPHGEPEMAQLANRANEFMNHGKAAIVAASDRLDEKLIAKRLINYRTTNVYERLSDGELMKTAEYAITAKISNEGLFNTIASHMKLRDIELLATLAKGSNDQIRTRMEEILADKQREQAAAAGNNVVSLRHAVA